MASSSENWQTYRFDEIAESITERIDDPSEADVDIYVGLEHLDPESLKIRRWGHPDDVSATKLRFWPGDIIFGRRRFYQRKLAVAEFQGICSAHALVLRAREDVVLPEFLPFFMQSEMFYERAMAISVGSLSPTINWRTLARQEFALPPKDEQRRIAAILWAAEEAIRAHQFALSQLEVSKNVARKHFFERGLGRRGFEKNKLGQMPVNWKVGQLGDVCKFLDNQRIPLKESERAKRQGPYPYYGASGIIDWIDGYIFDEPLILLSEDGMNLMYRNSPVAFKVDGKIWVNNHAHVLRVLGENNIDFYVEYLESISYEKYRTGTYQIKINKSVCEKIPVPVPPPEEQTAIAGLLIQFNQQIEQHINHLEKLSRTKTALLAQFLDV